MKKLPDYGKISFDDFGGMKFEDIVPEACAGALDLLKKFLVYRSKQRISAQQVEMMMRLHKLIRLSLFFLFSLESRRCFIFISTQLHCLVITQIYQFQLDEKIDTFMNLISNEASLTISLITTRFYRSTFRKSQPTSMENVYFYVRFILLIGS